MRPPKKSAFMVDYSTRQNKLSGIFTDEFVSHRVIYFVLDGWINDKILRFALNDTAYISYAQIV